MTIRSRSLPMYSLVYCSVRTQMTCLSGSIAVSPGDAGGDIGHCATSLVRRRRRLRATTSRACLVLALSLGAGLSLWPQVAPAQQATQGGGNGSGRSFGEGGIAGGGGGAGAGASYVGPVSGSAGGSAALTPDGFPSAGEPGNDEAEGAGGAGGLAGAPGDLAAGGGGGGGHGGTIYDPMFPGHGGAGGAGAGGNLIDTISPLSLGVDYTGGAGVAGSSPGGFFAGRGGGGGGGGGLVLSGAGVAMNMNGFSVSGGAGGGAGAGAGGGGGGAGLVLLDGGTITVTTGAGGLSVIAGGQGGDGYEGGHGGAGLFLYNGGGVSHETGLITGGSGGTGAFVGYGGAGVLSNHGIIGNRATITGGKGGDSNAGGTGYGQGGAGIEAWGGSIANSASGIITGGAGGNQSNANSVFVAGDGGAGIVLRSGQTASLDNAGTISGGNGGTAASSSVGAGGIGIVGAASGGISIVNSGAIAGGLAGDGAAQANAVELYGSNNRFEIRAGSTTSGNVVAQAGGVNNVLALGGGTNGTVDIGNLMATHTDFTTFEKSGASTWELSGIGSQNWYIREGSLTGNSDSMAGNLTFATGAGTRGVVFQGSGTYSGTISGDGSFTLAGWANSPLTLTNMHSYTGATAVNAGALIVNGSIAASSGVTVASGALLGGTGALPATVIDGGTLSPGNSPGTLTVNGDLTFNSGSTYLAEIHGANADRVNVTGSAVLGGTLRLAPLGGAYSFNSAYTLLSATGGATGVFSPVDTTGTFGAGVITTVSYTANDVLLTLTPTSLTPARLGVIAPRNARAVATAIDIAVDKGADPSSLFDIYNLPAAAIPTAVNNLSGEIHTATPAMAYLASDQFLHTMLDPMTAGRLGAGPTVSGADGQATLAGLDEPFHSVWGTAYGSYGTIDGSAAIGSTERRIHDAHLAAGIDVQLLPGTVAGIAVSGGRTNASLPDLLGTVDADVYQAGLYGMTQLGQVKLAGAISYARLENDISRLIPVLGSSLSSSYATTAWSGRLQASAEVLDWNGFTLSPLAAVQATQARSPAVIEANGAGALALGRRSDVIGRGEFGVQVDADTLLGGVPVTGYARAAWAHYFRRDADMTASLCDLPGASFTATGAEIDSNSLLVSVGVMARMSERLSLGLNLDSEFSAKSNRTGGSVKLKVRF